MLSVDSFLDGRAAFDLSRSLAAVQVLVDFEMSG